MAGSARPQLPRRPAASLAGPGRPERAAEGEAAAEGAATALVPAGLRALGRTIVWISGSLAGISAILYALGYLVTVANLDMLGLDPLAFRYDPTFYIERGAGFLQVSGLYVGQLWLPLLVVLALAVPAGQMALRHEAKWLTKGPFRTLAHHRDWWKAAGYVALLLLLGAQLRSHFLYPQDLGVSGMLHATADSGAGGGPIREWILAGDEARLQDRYSVFVNQQMVIVVLTLAAWGLARAWRWRALLLAPFAIVLAISFVWLPLEYGKLALPNKFPQVLVRLERAAESAGPAPAIMYLLNKTESEFVLWDADRRKIVWVPSRMVMSAEISASRTLSQIMKSTGTASR